MLYILRLIVIAILVLTPVVLLSSCGGGGGGSSDASTDTGSGGGTAAAVTYNGTVFADLAGSTPAPGVTVVITETGGNQIMLVADGNGAFSTTQGNPGGGYTATIQGNATPMIAGQVNGTCSAGGCHDRATQPVIYTN